MLERPRRLRRRRPLRGALERPARRSRPEAHRGHQSRRDASPRTCGARGRRPAVRLRVVLLDVRRLGDRRRARRERAAPAADCVRGVEGSLGGGALRARRARTSRRCRCGTRPSSASSPRLRLDIVLNNLAAYAHTTGRITLLSDGTAWRPLVHVRDVAKTALTLLEAPEDAIRGEAFNVGTDEQNYRVRELAEILAQVTGCEIEIAEGSSADNRSYRVDFSKLAEAFPGLVLDWNAERGARELVDAYGDVGLTLEDFEGDRYVRLRRLRTLLDDGSLAADLRWACARRPDGDLADRPGRGLALTRCGAAVSVSSCREGEGVVVGSGSPDRQSRHAQADGLWPLSCSPQRC